MSTYYDIACKDCKEKHWIASRSAGSTKPRLFRDYDLDKFNEFLIDHEEHHLSFVSEDNFQQEYHDPLRERCFCNKCEQLKK